MAIEFQIQPHGILPGVSVVAIYLEGSLAAVMYPSGESGIKLVSAHMSNQAVDEDFAGTITFDDGTASQPPIPCVLVDFKVGPYTIRGNRIVKL